MLKGLRKERSCTTHLLYIQFPGKIGEKAEFDFKKETKEREKLIRLTIMRFELHSIQARTLYTKFCLVERVMKLELYFQNM